MENNKVKLKRAATVAGLAIFLMLWALFGIYGFLRFFERVGWL